MDQVLPPPTIDGSRGQAGDDSPAMPDLLRGLAQAEAEMARRRASSPPAEPAADPASQRSLALLAAIVASAQDAIVSSDEHELITTWNPAAERLFGYSASEAIGAPFSLIAPLEDEVERQEFLDEVVARQATICLETKRRRKDGALIEVETTVTTVRDAGGAFLGYASITRDISERTARERQRREFESRYRLFFEKMPGLPYIYAPGPAGSGSGTMHLSQQLADLTGYPAELRTTEGDLTGTFVHPDDRDRVRTILGQVNAFTKPLLAEYRIVTMDGRELWVRDQANLVAGDGEAPAYWLGFMVDISDQMHAEAALAASEVRFRTVFEDAPIGMAVVDLNRRIVEANRAFCAMLGYAEPELVRNTSHDLTHPDDLDLDLDLVGRTLRGETDRYDLEKRYIRQDGGTVWGYLSASLVRDGAGRPWYFTAQIQDITERKTAAAEREATHQNTHEVLERITDGFFALDRAWRFTYVNQMAEHLMGRSREQLLGANAWEEFAGVLDTPLYVAAQRAMTDGVTTDYEFFYPPNDAWFGGQIYPSPAGVSVFFRDVTEQKRAAAASAELLAQLQKTNRELQQLNAAKSQFVTTISHEFRTPLTSTQGFSELIESEDLSRPDVKQFAATINRNAVRLARMVGDVLDLDRMEAGRITLQFAATNLNDLVQMVLETLGPIATRHTIDLHLAPDLPDLQCDPDLVVRMVTNIVANAIKYSPAGGPVTVSTVDRGAEVELTVADQGLGIPEDDRERIFMSYGRIDRPEQAGIVGTGLGLPIARNIVELHRGRIWVEANRPAGSIFHVLLPVAERGE